MIVKVLFFGVTADLTGHRLVEMDVMDETKASDVFEKLILEHPRLASHKLHLSINQQYAIGGEMLRAGDELAIFSAVSGG